ncbi:MAG: hypothetical protein ABIJ81_00220 [Patescibacteria group bacterium]
MKECIKQFFGSLWKSAIIRIVFGLMLFVIITFIHSVVWSVPDYWVSGWPLHFSESWGPCPTGVVCQNINIIALIFDIVFWYVIWCLTVLIYKKVKGKTPA